MALLSLYSDYTAFCRSVVIETNVTQNFFFDSFVGNCEIDLEIKRYFCRAGVQSIQVRLFFFLSFLSSQFLCAPLRKRIVTFLLMRSIFEVKVLIVGCT